MTKNESAAVFILNTDMGNDIDDAIALRMLHNLAMRGGSPERAPAGGRACSAAPPVEQVHALGVWQRLPRPAALAHASQPEHEETCYP